MSTAKEDTDDRELAAEVGTAVPTSGSELGTRIAQLVEAVGGPSAAAKIAGKSAEQIRRYADERSSAGFEPIARLALAAGYSLDWVATGAGKQRQADMVVRAADGSEIAIEAKVLHNDLVPLPLYDVSAAAGAGNFVSERREQVADWIYFRRDWLRRTLGVSPSRLAMITATGDSMSPTVDDGDLLIVDTSEPKLKGEGIYVLAVEEALLVKRLAIRPDGGLTLRSDNPRYEPMELPRVPGQRVTLVGRVLWAGGRI